MFVGLAVLEDCCRERGILDESVAEIMNQNKESMIVAVEILDDFLSFEKLNAHKMVLECTNENPYELVTSAVRSFMIQAASKGVLLLQPPRPTSGSRLSTCCVFVDKFKMNQVLRNFLSNAIKFTQRGDSISVRILLLPDVLSNSQHLDHSINVEGGIDSPVANASSSYFNSGMKYLSSSKATAVTPQTTWLRIEVEDTGAGIAKENLPRLFREIVQFDANKLQAGKGTGLGMFITRDIVELHGGRVGVKSDGVGQGSLFSVDLPFVDCLGQFNPNSHLTVPARTDRLGDWLEQENELDRRTRLGSTKVGDARGQMLSHESRKSDVSLLGAQVVNGWITQANEELEIRSSMYHHSNNGLPSLLRPDEIDVENNANMINDPVSQISENLLSNFVHTPGSIHSHSSHRTNARLSFKAQFGYWVF